MAHAADARREQQVDRSICFLGKASERGSQRFVHIKKERDRVKKGSAIDPILTVPFLFCSITQMQPNAADAVHVFQPLSCPLVISLIIRLCTRQISILGIHHHAPLAFAQLIFSQSSADSKRYTAAVLYRQTH